MALFDKDAVQEAYEEVRSDASDINWFVLSYVEGQKLEIKAKGIEYDDFLALIGDERLHAYVRRVTGDEMSRRSKFAFITWCPPETRPLDKAKLSTNKAAIQGIVANFAIEVFATEKDDLRSDVIDDKLTKAGGASYGRGK